RLVMNDLLVDPNSPPEPRRSARIAAQEEARSSGVRNQLDGDQPGSSANEAPGADQAPAADQDQAPNGGAGAASPNAKTPGWYEFGIVGTMLAVVSFVGIIVQWSASTPVLLCAKESIPFVSPQQNAGLAHILVPKIGSTTDGEWTTSFLPCANAETYNRAYLSALLKLAGNGLRKVERGNLTIDHTDADKSFELASVRYARAVARVSEVSEDVLLQNFHPFFDRIRCRKLWEMPANEDPFKFPTGLCQEAEIVDDGSDWPEGNIHKHDTMLSRQYQESLIFLALTYGEYGNSTFDLARETAGDETKQHLNVIGDDHQSIRNHILQGKVTQHTATAISEALQVIMKRLNKLTLTNPTPGQNWPDYFADRSDSYLGLNCFGVCRFLQYEMLQELIHTNKSVYVFLYLSLFTGVNVALLGLYSCS
ncbi:hypothetical protein PFISCL1PPCAC_17667, partial [Pristionchus fissidentatus]